MVFWNTSFTLFIHKLINLTIILKDSIHTCKCNVIALQLSYYLPIVFDSSFSPETSQKGMATAEEPPPLYPNIPSLLVQALLPLHPSHSIDRTTHFLHIGMFLFLLGICFDHVGCGATVPQPLVSQKCRLQMNRWIRSCWVDLSFGGKSWCVWVLWRPGQGFESHLRVQLLLVCGGGEMTVSEGVPCGGDWRGHCSRCSGVCGYVGHQGQWGSSVMPSLYRCELRRL